MNDFPSYGYLLILLISLFGVFTLDRKLKLAFFVDKTAAAVSVASLVILLLIADVVGIYWDIFFTNEAYTTGINILTPNLPIEEVLLLTLISYTTLLIYRWAEPRG